MLSFEVTVLDSYTQKCSSYTGSIYPDFYHCLHSYMIQIVVDVCLWVSHSMQISLCHLVDFDELSEQVALSLFT